MGAAFSTVRQSGGNCAIVIGGFPFATGAPGLGGGAGTTGRDRISIHLSRFLPQPSSAKAG